DARERSLRRDGQPVPVSAKVFDVLLVLARHKGRLIRKEDLLQAVWPNQVVEESNVAHNISAVRSLLRQAAGDQCDSETIRGYGYRRKVRGPSAKAGATVSAADPAKTDPPRIRLIERMRELDLLTELLGNTRRGQRQTVFITGEPGAGASSLLE